MNGRRIICSEFVYGTDLDECCTLLVLVVQVVEASTTARQLIRNSQHIAVYMDCEELYESCPT